MMIRRMILLPLAVVATTTCLQARAERSAAPRGAGTVEFVDGVKSGCEILFKHPNCDRLVVRSAVRSTIQSIQLTLIHAVSVAGKTVTFSPRRALTVLEKTLRETNRLWGDEVGPARIGRYAKQEWASKGLIIWARPGVSGEFDKAANWLNEKGQPCSVSPWRVDIVEERPQGRFRRKPGPETGQFDGDVLLPSAATQYSVVQSGNRDHLGAFRLRHLTIERNASYAVRYTIRGNLWMKDGATIGKGTQTGGFGSGESDWSTFARFCGGPRTDRKRSGDKYKPQWTTVSHWVWIDTGRRGSLEIIGRSGGPGDRLTLKRGTLIVSEDSYIGNGNRGSYYCMPDTTTILLDGAGVGCRHRIIARGRATYGIAGTLLCGTPKHPLTRDLIIPCGLYNIEDLMPEPQVGQRTTGASFVLGATGRIIVNSKDSKKARVVFRPIGEGNPVSKYVVAPRANNRPTPTGITAVFAGKVCFDGVVFEGFYKRGVIVSPDSRRKWKNVSVGAGAATASDLFIPPGPQSERILPK